MTTNDIKTRFAELYENMRTSRDVSKMKRFGVAFSMMFDKVAIQHPDIAMATLDFLAGMEYNNFVTPVEANNVAGGFINDDTFLSGASEPSRGAHWPMEILKGFLTQRGIPLEEKPYYNWPSLWLTVNMIFSDYADALTKIVGSKDNEKIAMASYSLAVKKLKDRDRPQFIRDYFDLDE